MSDIELVIKLSEEEYKYIKGIQFCTLGIRGGKGLLSKILNAVRTGTPLPKGHGRIGDLDALERDMIGGIKAANFEEGYADYAHINNVDDCVDCVRYADTIIDADRE